MKGTDGIWVGQTIVEEQMGMLHALTLRLQELNWGSLYTISPGAIAIQPLFGEPDLSGRSRAIFIDPFAFGQDTLQWSMNHMDFLLAMYRTMGKDPSKTNQENYKVHCRECGHVSVGLVGYVTLAKHPVVSCPVCGLPGAIPEILPDDDEGAIIDG